jgi:phytoene/squalene synthetase
VLPQHGVVTEDVFKGNFTRELHEAVYEVANVAFAHLEHSRELKSQVKYPAQIALLPAVRVRNHGNLERILCIVTNWHCFFRSGIRAQLLDQVAKARF